MHEGTLRPEVERLLGFPEQTVYDWLATVAERNPDVLGELPPPRPLDTAY